MSSPLFRWKFETPKRPVWRTDSEETFYEVAEKDGTKDPKFQNPKFQNENEDVHMMECSQDFLSSDGFADEARSEAELTPLVPVPRNRIPSGNSTSSNNSPAQSNAEKTSRFPDTQNNFDLKAQNSQRHKRTNESMTRASSNRKKTTVPSSNTFYEEADKMCVGGIGEKNCCRSLLRCAAQTSTCNAQEVLKMTQEILTGLDDSQFNTYDVKRFEEKFEQADVPIRSELNRSSKKCTCHAPEDLQTSLEILTSLNDSQFNGYPTDRNSQAPSTEETFFEEEKVERVDVNKRGELLPTSEISTSTCKAPEDLEMSVEILTGLNDSQFNVYPTDRNSQAPSTDETFFEEEKVGRVDVNKRDELLPTSEISTGTCKTPEDLEMSVEILTGLNDSQFSVYPTNRNSQALSTDVTFFEEEKFEQVDVKNRGELRSTSEKSTCKSSKDLQTSVEILTCLNDSQFSAKRNSLAPSSDATFFELAGKRNEAYGGGHQSCQEGSGHDEKNNVELPKASTSVFGSVPLSQDPVLSGISPVVPDSGACLNDEYGQDIIKLIIEDMPAYPMVDLTDLSNIIEMLESSPDSRDFVDISPPLDGNADEIFNELNSPPSPSGFQLCPSKDNCQTPRTGNQVVNQQKRVLSPLHVGERKKRKKNDLKSAQQVRPIGKPHLSRIKKAEKTRVPLTPCHPMSLRKMRDRSAEGTPRCDKSMSWRDNTSDQKTSLLDSDSLDPKSRKKGTHKCESLYQTTKSTSKSSSPKSSGKKNSSQRRQNTPFDPDYTGANPRKLNTWRRTDFAMQTPLSEITAKKQGKTPKSSQKLVFKRDPIQNGGKRGRPAKQCTSETFLPVISKLQIRENGCSASKGKSSLRKISLHISELNLGTPRKLFGSRPCGDCEGEVPDAAEDFFAQLRKDKTCLRNIQKKLLEVILDEATITRKKAENMRREIIEKQQRICMWNQSGFGRDNVPVCGQMRELEALSETLLRQIETILDGFSSGENEQLPSPGINFISHPPHDIEPLGPSPRPELQNISERDVQEREVTSKSTLDGAVANLHGRRKSTPAKHARNNRDKKHRKLSGVGFDGVRRVGTPRCSPVRLVSSADRPEDILAEQTLSSRRRNKKDFSLEPIAERSPTNTCVCACACGASSVKAYVNVGTDTDFLELHNKSEKKIFVDRSTNTDPEDLGDERKVLVDCGTNTEYLCSEDLTSNLQGGRKVLSSVNKENIKTKLDLKNITHVWLPRREDFMHCSYDNLPPGYFENPNAELPQELLDDLTWED